MRAAEGLAREHGVDLEQSFFYSDSHDDIELLERVGHPQPLNPNTKLTEISERHGWPVRRFKSRGQPGVFDFVRSVAATASLVPSALAGLPIWALTGSQREARNFATSLFADVSSALIGLNLVIRGEENLWSQRPAVFVFNHQSKADVVIIARLLRRDFAGVGKKEIKDSPLIGKTLELAGTVFIDRENAASAIEAMQPLVDAMRNEAQVRRYRAGRHPHDFPEAGPVQERGVSPGHPGRRPGGADRDTQCRRRCAERRFRIPPGHCRG